MRAKILKIVIPILVGIGCLFVPLLQNFHIESAIAAATVGCFWAGWAAAGKRSTSRSDILKVLSILGSVYLFGFVLFVHALIGGCFSFYGLEYWLLYPIPSIFFGYSIGRFLKVLGVPLRRFIVIIILLAVGIGVWLLEFFNLPQVYFFNHVWGGWPGPIYDETLKPGLSLVYFRILTFAWIGFFWWVPEILSAAKAKLIVIVCIILLALGYTHLPVLGITSPNAYLQKKLAGVKRTPHFVLYYDKNHYTKDYIAFIAQKEEFYYHQITTKLNLSQQRNGNKIQSYLYGNVWQKNRLVGAKYTSYVPVWLDQDQLHIAKGQIAGSLKHELVHILAKQFGNKLLNASWSIGLVEGLAVALSGGQSSVSTIDEIVRAEKPYPTAQQMKHALSFWGFYGGQATVNYIQSGSFVKYLLNNYSVANFKQAYRTGNIEKAYPVPFKKLVIGWHQSLDTVNVDRTDQNVASVLYSVPSLFQQKCPHMQTHAAYLKDRFRYYMALKDTSRALSYLSRLRTLFLKRGLSSGMETTWLYLQLKTGHVQKVLQAADIEEHSVSKLLLYADAFALSENIQTAERYLTKASRLLRKNTIPALQLALNTRKNRKNWQIYRAIVYHQQAVTNFVFKKLDVHTQARALRQAINLQKWNELKRYARLIAQGTISIIYFDTYNRAIQWLAFLGAHSVAIELIQKLKTLPLRKRYKQRLSESRQWVHFEKVNQHP